MLFLVDGYNVTMRDPATCALAKEQQRDALVRRLACRSREMLGRGEVVVVFDARGQLGVSAEAVSGVKVVYAPDADTEIVARCSAARGEVTVVSSDKRLSARISQDVARRVVYREASACFEEAGRGELRKGDRRGAARRGERPQPGTDEGAPPRADEITRELEGIWLANEDRDRESTE